jgi:hypothetical protein
MKKAAIGMAIWVMMLSGVVHAEGIMGSGKYGAAGCGLGSMVFGDEPGAIQILAATTNNIIIPQTFAISTGTSNCTSPSKTANNDKLLEFAAANLDSLAKEIAAGRGEALDTLAELMGIPVNERQLIYAKFQVSFSKIFSSGKVEAGSVIDTIITIVNS